MAHISYNGEVYTCNDDETLLKAFMRQRVKVPFSCGGGVCHVCMHRCTSGVIPDEAQKGLRDIYKKNDFILICKCVPQSDMEIELVDKRYRFNRMSVNSVESDDGKILCLLESFTAFVYKQGQFVNLLDGNGRNICGEIKSDSTVDELLCISIKPNDGNGISHELLSRLEEVEIQGPFDEPFNEIEMEAGLKRDFPEPDPALWKALDEGRLLIPILKEFYKRVFSDSILGPFFVDTTQQRLVEKQYNFLRQAITGEKVFFGERPRNSHHWMVITDEIFDHREKIHEEVFRDFGVPQEIIEKLSAIDEIYRSDIVKDKPWPKVLFGKVVPLEGFEPLVLDEATICDGCSAELVSGEEVYYHVRTGKVYCSGCNK